MKHFWNNSLDKAFVKLDRKENNLANIYERVTIMSSIKHFLSLTIYSVLIINAIVMTLQYFFGLGSIAGKIFKVIDTVSLALL